jgi:hypothetical protein
VLQGGEGRQWEGGTLSGAYYAPVDRRRVACLA